MGFFVICAGVVLLQLSKSAKDVPDTAVFAGDLDQVRTIAEQEQPESEPKADAIRGAAAIVRRFSTARQKMEIDEARRLHEEKLRDLEPIGENEHVEWDGLRRRRTTFGTNRSRGDSNVPFPAYDNAVQTPRQHPPLGMSHFPTDSDSDHDEERPNTGNVSSFIGSIRNRAKSMVVPGQNRNLGSGTPNVQSPMHPVPLTEIAIPTYKGNEDGSGVPYYGHDGQSDDRTYSLPLGPLDQKTEYEGAGGQRERHITIVDDGASSRTGSRGSSLHPSTGPTPPPHSARRQFSFQNVFRKGQPPPQTHGDEQAPPSRSPMIRKGLGARKHSGGSAVKGATEEERLGLVKGDTATGRQPTVPPYEDEEDDYDDLNDDKYSPGQRRSPERGPRRDLTPPRREGKEREKELEADVGSGRSSEEEYYEQQRKKWDGKQQGRGPPPPFDDGKSGDGAFI